MNKFGEFLTHKYLEYQLSQGRPVYIREFAEWLGVPPTSYSNWVNSGFKPSIKYTQMIADKLGVEIYDLLGYPRPAPSIALDQLPVELQSRLREFVSEVAGSLGGINPESDEANVIVRSAIVKFFLTNNEKEYLGYSGTEK